MKIKRGWQLFAAVIEVTIMAAVALFGAVMIAVPVPVLLHFLSKYGVTGDACDDDLPPCRCAAADRRSMGDPFLLATVESFVSRWTMIARYCMVKRALFLRDAAFAKADLPCAARGHAKVGASASAPTRHANRPIPTPNSTPLRDRRRQSTCRHLCCLAGRAPGRTKAEQRSQPELFVARDSGLAAAADARSLCSSRRPPQVAGRRAPSKHKPRSQSRPATRHATARGIPATGLRALGADPFGASPFQRQ